MAGEGVVSDEQLHTLALIGGLDGAEDFYLAGGTAVAYHLGHRRSLDLDIFSRHGGVDLERLRRRLVEELDGVEVIAATEVTVQLKVGASPVDIVSYPYPPLEEPVAGPAGFPVASLVDLSTMKLAAIAKRGIKRDFWDLYEILSRTRLSLGDCLDAYGRRFGQRESELYYVLRSLTFFEDADKETISPRGLSPQQWSAVKQFFTTRAPEALE
jgi:hypothetical protein